MESYQQERNKFGISVPIDPFYDFFTAKPNDIMIDIIEALKKAGKHVVCATNTIHPHYQKLLDPFLFPSCIHINGFRLIKTLQGVL